MGPRASAVRVVATSRTAVPGSWGAWSVKLPPGAPAPAPRSAVWGPRWDMIPVRRSRVLGLAPHSLRPLLSLGGPCACEAQNPEAQANRLFLTGNLFF